MSDNELISTSGSVFELRDTTDDEIYYLVGIFRTKQDALKFIHSIEDPWNLCEYSDGYAELKIQEIPFGVGAKIRGKTVWQKAWKENYKESTDENKWEVYSPNDQTEPRR